MKLAKDWIALHGQSGEYPKVDEPIGCFTEAQIREIQLDAAFLTRNERYDLERAICEDMAKNQEQK